MVEPVSEGLIAKATQTVRQWSCGLHGHDTLPVFERHRMFLRCVSCGHESPGWEFSEAPPVPSTDPKQIVRSPVLGA